MIERRAEWTHAADTKADAEVQEVEMGVVTP